MAEAKTVLITGASSGIGLATAQLLLAQDYRVVGISRRGQPDDFAHDNFSAVKLDLTAFDRLESQLNELFGQFQFDGLVHAAGQGHFGSIEQFSVDQIENSIRINLTSAMIICRSLVPILRRRGQGDLIFIGSESALCTGKKGSLYSAAKFGLRGFCQALRADCAADGLRVSLINPGMVRSPFFDELSFQPAADPENAIEVADVAKVVWQVLQSRGDIVIDEINLSPRVKSIDLRK